MATRATKSGFAAEAQDKINSKYDAEFAASVMAWVDMRLKRGGQPGINTNGSMENVFETLGDGFILATLMNILGENIKNVKREKMAFKKMELISQFLAACERYGLPKTELFQTVDLYEKQNLNQVVQCIAALGRKAHTKDGLGFGPKESERQSREWTDEQLKAGQNIIGLQMGSNKGASQAGQNFGKARMIVD
ncbi:transgelin-2-like isoform X1 [Dreissena polymorpha]|uniref:Transgelin n=1 Tax=Dreissena polymorpha TaxID=45954 RepID=A0A9D4CG07_DREPO|nr:transgelin-2-like isoform X1 [Dreissena polymorpha]KAH3724232.1 hypothetical protein DPMN_050046 [Dreissena polymorpha]